MSGRKTKYSPEIAKTILEAIAGTGTDQAGYEAVAISKDTFYEWMRQFPDFSDSVIEARQQFQDLCPESLIAQARKVLADYLYGRVQRVETITKTKEVGGTVVEVETTTKTVTVLPPKWAIERVLGKSDHEKHLAALYALVKKIMVLEAADLGEIKSMIQADLETLLLEVGVEELRSLIGVKPSENGRNANKS